MQAAIYARVSTERQEKEQTIASQITALQQWICQQGHSLKAAHIFSDEGWSGSRLDRPALDALRDGAARGEFKIVGVLTPDRLARKYAYQVLLLEEFHRLGCEVVFIHHPLSQDPNDQLLLQIQGAVAEYERAVLAERFRRGKLQKARAGQWLGGTGPYGYRYLPRQQDSGGQLVIDESEAELVRMLYGWLIEEQMSIRQMLKRLNAGPWLPRSGKHAWSPSVVQHILSDPIYIGTAYRNRYYFVPPKKPRGTRSRRTAANSCRQPRPQAEWISISVPALVDQQTYDLAQAQLERNALLSFRHNTKYSYLLRCLLSCQSCGLAMFGRTSKSKVAGSTAQQTYYLCHGKDPILSARQTACPQRSVRAADLEPVIWGHVQNLLEDPEELVRQYQQFTQLALVGDCRQQAEVERLQVQRQRVEKEEKRLLDAYQAEVISLEELSERRQQLSARRQLLDHQQLAQQHQLVQIGQNQQVLTDLRLFSERIRTRLAQANFEEKQMILQLVIERVIVGEKTLEIRHIIPLHQLGEGSSILRVVENGSAGPPGPSVRPLCSDGMDYTSLPRGGGKSLFKRSYQPVVPICHGQIHPLHSTLSQVGEEGQPTLFTLFSAKT